MTLCPVCGDDDVRQCEYIGRKDSVTFDEIYYGAYKVCRFNDYIYGHGEPS